MEASTSPQAQFVNACLTLAAEFDLPGDFSVAVLDAAAVASKRFATPNADRIDLTELAFVTLDPTSSIDLDQAFVLSQTPDDIRLDTITLHYAIADVGFFVDTDSVIETEAWKRGETIYLPEYRVPQYPPVLCEGSVSLLPNGDRPAIVLEVGLDAHGTATLRSAKRAVVRSRKKLGYETTEPSEVNLLVEFSKRMVRGEDLRGASRSVLPEQSVDVDNNGVATLTCRNLLPSEVANSALSLAANLAVGKRFLEAGIGIFRVMDRPTDNEVKSLRRDAHSLNVDWPTNESLASFQRRLDPTNALHRSLLISARRFGGGASYATIGTGSETDLTDAPPYHSAIAATYSHVTAPLRRLADRYALDLIVALDSSHTQFEPKTLSTLAALPAVMKMSGQRSAKVERAVIDLVEAIVLQPRVGEQFAAVVLESGDSGAVMQLDALAVRARLPRSANVEAGSQITVTLVSVDIAARRLVFTLTTDTVPSSVPNSGVQNG